MRRAVEDRIRWAERGVAWIRLLVTGSGVAIYPWMIQTTSPRALGIGVLAFSFAYSVLLLLVTRRPQYPVILWSYLTLTFDLALTLLSIRVTGGVHSAVMPALFVVTFSFAYRYPARETLVGGALATVGYAVVTTHAGQLATDGIVIVTHCVYLLVAAIVGALISREALWQRYQKRQLENLSEVQKQTETKLRESALHLVEAQRLARIGEWHFDPVQRAFTPSREASLLFGLREGEQTLPPEALAAHLHDDDRRLLLAALDEAAGTSFDLELRVVLPNATERWVRAVGRAEPISSGAGKVVTGVVQDIHDLKQAHDDRVRLAQETAARAAAEEAIRARDDFLSVASHELKTPLAALRLEHDLLTRVLDKTLPAESRAPLDERLARVNRQLDRLSKLVQSLLDVTRLAAGRPALEPERIDLSALLEDSLARSQETVRRAGSTVERAVEPNVLGTWDRIRLEQIIDNLLSNALKYGAGKPIRVSLSRDGEWARLQVSDQGIGIAPEDQARVFERFERAVSGRHFGGLGLGLWIVRQTVVEMGGLVSVRSEPGRGATFEVLLPLHTGPAAERAPR